MIYYKVECWSRFIEKGDCPADYLGLTGFTTTPVTDLSKCLDYPLSFSDPSCIDAIVIRKVDSSSRISNSVLAEEDSILLHFDSL